MAAVGIRNELENIYIYIFVVNIPDKIVALSDISVGVFCKSGKNV